MTVSSTMTAARPHQHLADLIVNGPLYSQALHIAARLTSFTFPDNFADIIYLPHIDGEEETDLVTRWRYCPLLPQFSAPAYCRRIALKNK